MLESVFCWSSVLSCTVAKIRSIYSYFFCMVSRKKLLSNSITPFRMLSKPVETHSMEEFKRPSDQLFAKGAEYCLLSYSPFKKTRKINEGRTVKKSEEIEKVPGCIKHLQNNLIFSVKMLQMVMNKSCPHLLICFIRFLFWGKARTLQLECFSLCSSKTFHNFYLLILCYEWSCFESWKGKSI